MPLSIDADLADHTVPWGAKLRALFHVGHNDDGTLKPVLTPTGVKTSAYSAAAFDLVPVDTTSGSVTVTLPAAPVDGAIVAVKHVIRGGSNVVTVARGGSTDVFNKAAGSTSLTLSLVNQSTVLQYKASSGIWYATATDPGAIAAGTGYAGPAPSASIGTPTQRYNQTLSSQTATSAIHPASTVTAGTLAVIFIKTGGSGKGVSSVTDSVGNVWTIHHTLANSNATMVAASCQVVTQILTTDTITITYSTGGSATCVIAIQETPGLADYIALDAASIVDGSGTGTAVSAGPTPTLAQANEIVWGFFASTGGGGWTKGASYTNSSSMGSFTGLEYKTVASNTPVTADGTFGTSGTWFGFTLAFKMVDASGYPGTLDTLTVAHAVGDPVKAVDVNLLADAINKIEAALGPNPFGDKTTAAAAFEFLFPDYNYVDVGDYGADPTGADFSDAAFQAAFEAARAFATYDGNFNVNNGTAILGKSGVYKFANQVMFPPGQYPAGLGQLKFPTDSGYSTAIGLSNVNVTGVVGPGGITSIELQNVRGTFNPGGGKAVFYIWELTYTGTTLYTVATTVTGINALNSATVNVGDTSKFPSSGYFILGGVATRYTGKTSTSFTGCGTHAATTGGETIADYHSVTLTGCSMPGGQHGTINALAPQSVIGNCAVLSASNRVGIGLLSGTSLVGPNSSMGTLTGVPPENKMDGLYLPGSGVLYGSTFGFRMGVVLFGDHEVITAGAGNSSNGYANVAVLSPYGVNWPVTDSGNQKFDGDAVFTYGAWCNIFIGANTELLAATFGGQTHWGFSNYWMYKEDTTNVPNAVLNMVSGCEMYSPKWENLGSGITNAAGTGSIAGLTIYSGSVSGALSVCGFGAGTGSISIRLIGDPGIVLSGSAVYFLCDNLRGELIASPKPGATQTFFTANAMQSPGGLTPPYCLFKFPGGALVSGSANNVIQGDLVQAVATLTDGTFTFPKYAQHNSNIAPVAGVARLNETNYVIQIATDIQAGPVGVNVNGSGDITAGSIVRAAGTAHPGKAASASGLSDTTAPTFAWATVADGGTNSAKILIQPAIM